MKRKLIFILAIILILGLFLGVTGFQGTSPYSRRIRPFFGGFPGSCVENEIGYDMTSHTLAICDNSLTYKLISFGGAGGSSVLTSPVTIGVGQTTTAATDLLINPTTKASGNLIDAQVNGVSQFFVTSAGLVQTSGTLIGAANIRTNGGFTWPAPAGNDTGLYRGSAGVVLVSTSSSNGLGTIGATTYRTGPTNILYSSGTPAIAGNGTLNTNSKDSAGKVTTTGTGSSTIVLTFSASFTNAPACDASNETTTANLISARSTTGGVSLLGTVVSGDVISYKCLGY